MRALAAPVLLALAIALAPAASACHIGPGLGANAGVVMTADGPALAALGLPFGDFCEGATTLTLHDLSPLGRPPETIPVTLDILAPPNRCIDLSCGGSDPFAAALRFTGPEAGLDLVGVFEFPHVTAGWAFAGTVHGAPAVFGASAV